MTDFILSGPAAAAHVVLLAHGAGAPVTSGWMETMAEKLGEAGLAVARFNFSYMAARVETGSRRPPPRAEALVPEYEAAVATLGGRLAKGQTLLIGGKSMGGRVASLAAQDLYERGRIGGLVCLGYPFHPRGAPQSLRTAHLMRLSCPTLIVQGARDPFGTREEVAGYGLPAGLRVVWAPDGDHDLKPRRGSGATAAGNMRAAAEAVAAFAAGLPSAR